MVPEGYYNITIDSRNTVNMETYGKVKNLKERPPLVSHSPIQDANVCLKCRLCNTFEIVFFLSSYNKKTFTNYENLISEEQYGLGLTF